MAEENLKVLGKSIPEAQYVNRTITIRDMSLPQDVLLTKQSLLRWFALAVGALSEQESRSTVVPILDAMLYYQVKERKDPSVQDIKDYLDSEKWGMRGKDEEHAIPEKAIRYNLGKLKAAGIIEERERRWRFVLDPKAPELRKAVDYSLKNAVQESTERINTAFAALLKMYVEKE
jgi:hypothetical protein